MHPLVEHIGNLSVMELVALTKDMEEKFGVKASDVVVQMENTFGPAMEKVVEKTEFALSIIGFTDKVGSIKLFKELFGMPLMEAKTFLEVIPKVIKDGMTKEACQTYTDRFDAAGVKYEVL